MRMNVIVAGACTDAVLSSTSKLGIGVGNGLPWQLPNEFKHFVKCTTHVEDETKRNVVMMGRKVWDSIPPKFRPLRKRINIVLSRSMPPSTVPDVHVCRSMEEAERLIESMEDTIETVWNIGGRDLYNHALKSPSLHRIYVTHIRTPFDDCDVFFPAADWSTEWREVQHDALNGEAGSVHCEKDVQYTFHVFERSTQ